MRSNNSHRDGNRIPGDSQLIDNTLMIYPAQVKLGSELNLVVNIVADLIRKMWEVNVTSLGFI